MAKKVLPIEMCFRLKSARIRRDHEQRARLWTQSAEMDPSKRSSMLIPQTGAIARQVCWNARSDAFLQREDVESILKGLRNYPRPDALDHVYQQVAEF